MQRQFKSCWFKISWRLDYLLFFICFTNSKIVDEGFSIEAETKFQTTNEYDKVKNAGSYRTGVPVYRSNSCLDMFQAKLSTMS